MNDNELHIDRTCHVLYSKPCKKEIQKRIALHYPAEKTGEVWEQVQRKYAEFLSDWRTDLGGKKNFHRTPRFHESDVLPLGDHEGVGLVAGENVVFFDDHVFVGNDAV